MKKTIISNFGRLARRYYIDVDWLHVMISFTVGLCEYKVDPLIRLRILNS